MLKSGKKTLSLLDSKGISQLDAIKAFFNSKKEYETFMKLKISEVVGKDKVLTNGMDGAKSYLKEVYDLFGRNGLKNDLKKLISKDILNKNLTHITEFTLKLQELFDKDVEALSKKFISIIGKNEISTQIIGETKSGNSISMGLIVIRKSGECDKILTERAKIETIKELKRELLKK